MEHTRPYWKVVLSLIISLTITLLVVALGYGLLRLLLPFVIGWLIACIANPMVCWLEKHFRIVKKLGSAITIVLVLGLVVGDEIGLKPLPTLLLIYIGYKMGSVWGMIIAVPVGMILINGMQCLKE